MKANDNSFCRGNIILIFLDTFHYDKAFTCWDSQHFQQVTRKKCPAQQKTPRYARIVASYLSAEKQHAKDDKNNGGAWPLALITSQVAWINSRHHTVGSRATASIWTKTTASNLPACKPSFHQERRVLPSLAHPWTALCVPYTEMTTSLPCHLPSGEKWEHIKGVTEMWLERPLVASNPLLVSLCLLIVPLCHWKMSACNNKIWGILECLFPPQYPRKWPNKCQIQTDQTVKVGQTPSSALTVSSCSSSEPGLFAFKRWENDCLTGRGSEPSVQRQGGVSWTQLELWWELDTKAGWSLEGLAQAHMCSHTHTIATHAAAQFLFKPGSVPPKDAHHTWLIFMLKP